VIDEIIQDAKSRMNKTLETLVTNLKKVRTGRAHPSILDSVRVEYYGSPTQLSQVANIAIEDGRTHEVTPWEKDMVIKDAKAIMSDD